MKSETNPATQVRLGIRQERVEVGAHIAYFWESPQEFQEGVNFLFAGLRDGDACVVFGHSEANERVVKMMRDAGEDIESLKKRGRLAVLGGAPLGETMLGEIGATFTRLMASGAPLIRLLGNIGWGHSGWPGEEDILEFEAKVTGAAKMFPCVVVCMYDVRSLSGRVMIHGAMETHPITVCGNVMRHNPYYVEVDQFLSKRKKSIA